jgi:hypothetical protein
VVSRCRWCRGLLGSRYPGRDIARTHGGAGGLVVGYAQCAMERDVQRSIWVYLGDEKTRVLC